MDTATAFYPWYAYLGENLRSGHVPMWNPHQFAGTPFAADPESGWTYLPAMLLFTVLPLTQAANAFLLVHVLLAGLATYALARSLGIRPIGAVVSAIAYSYSGFFFGHNVCCFAYSSVAAWLPVGLLGVERATRCVTWSQRTRWWAVGGLAISQILAAWLGQGAYYALLFLGAFVAYRTLVASASLASRVKAMVLHGVMLLSVGFGLAAIGLLPRIEYNALSNLPGGYAAAGLASPTAALTDWGIIDDWNTRLLTPGFHYVGVTTLVLALAAPWLVRGRQAVPFFVIMSIAVLVVARWQPTPLHVALSILPGFGPMHVHAPERALLVWFIGPALMAGASVGRVGETFARRGIVTAALLSLLVLLDLRSAWQTQVADALEASGAYELHQVDLAAYYAPTGAARFLQSTTGVDQARAIGYAQHVFGGPIAYTLGWANPKTVALGVNNRAVVAGVDDIQGYNPIHLARFDAFMRALNGRQLQNYHQTDVFEAGLGSPLLDLLGVRYIVMPAVPAADVVEPRLTRELPTVYADADVKILENDQAFSRAWVVHSAAQMDADDALARLAAGAIDPRRTVVLEKPAPPLADSPLVADQATITEYAADTVRLDVDTGAPGLLVLSDAYYPAWQARVDGSPTEVYVADAALRAVAVPAGRHAVEFQYASAALPLGAAITGLTLLALAGCTTLRTTRAWCA